MVVRPFLPSDLPLIQKWAAERGMACPTLGLLPANGFIAGNIAALFLMLTDSGVAQMDWAIADPDAENVDVGEAFKAMTPYIVGLAKDKGASLLTGFTSSPLLISVLWQLGFMSNERPHFHLIKYL